MCRTCGQGRPVRPNSFREEKRGTSRTAFSGWNLFFIPCAVILVALFASAFRDCISWPPRLETALAVPLAAALFYFAITAFWKALTQRGKYQLSSTIYSASKSSQRGKRYRGVVSPLHGLLASHLSRDEGIVVCLSFYGASMDNVHLRSSRAAELMLTLETGEALVVAGEMWVEAQSPTHTRPQEETQPIIQNLGLLVRYPVPAPARETILREGDVVEVRGDAKEELVAQLARGYRDGGLTKILRGAAGEPLLVRIVGSVAR